MVKLYLYQKEAEGKTFYYVVIGSETHGRPTYRLWINRKLLTDELIEACRFSFPVKGARIEGGKDNRTLILKPDPNRNVFYYLKKCGYRGDSSVEVYDCGDDCKVYKFWEYSSPRGSTGVSEGVLVETSKDVIKVKWKRTGRLYGASPRGIALLYIDGREEELPIEDEELLKELE
ncbi:MAG: hypothetical protein ACO2OY_10645 [Thermodesulfobacteriaceae bacterium]|jgi:hypothetical protein